MLHSKNSNFNISVINIAIIIKNSTYIISFQNCLNFKLIYQNYYINYFNYIIQKLNYLIIISHINFQWVYSFIDYFIKIITNFAFNVIVINSIINFPNNANNFINLNFKDCFIIIKNFMKTLELNLEHNYFLNCKFINQYNLTHNHFCQFSYYKNFINIKENF